MDGFEQALKEGLRRQTPDEGFAARVCARIAEGHGARARPWWRLPQLRWGTAAALGLAMLVGLRFWQVRQEHARAEMAKTQVMVALRIAGAKMRFAQDRVRGVSPPRKADNRLAGDPEKHKTEAGL